MWNDQIYQALQQQKAEVQGQYDEAKKANLQRYGEGLAELRNARQAGFQQFNYRRFQIGRDASISSAMQMQAMMRRGLGSSTVLTSVQNRGQEMAGRLQGEVSSQAANYAFSSAQPIAQWIGSRSDPYPNLDSIRKDIRDYVKGASAIQTAASLAKTKKKGDPINGNDVPASYMQARGRIMENYSGSDADERIRLLNKNYGYED